MITQIDQWAKDAALTRSEAIRRLIDQALGSATASRKRARDHAPKAAEMAGREIDRLGDKTATHEERASRKRRLIAGPKEFRDMRRK